MKSYTDLEQSKTLAKILNEETADLWWDANEFKPRLEKHYHEYLSVTIDPIPCWSLATLLELIPSNNKANEYYVETESHSDCYIVRYKNCWDGCIHSEYSKESLLNAVFEMICWLKENGKI